MFLLKENGKTVTEMITVFAILSIIILAALPFYTRLIINIHQAKVRIAYNNIKTTIITATADSILINGEIKVPFPHQLTNDRIINFPDSNNWINDRKGIWTYLPTRAVIIYNKISDNDYTLELKL